MAAEDTERYKTEMQAYNGRQEAKMRSEALKPPAQQYPGATGAGRGAEGFAGAGAGMDAARGGMAGYPEQMANMSAFAGPAGAAAMGAQGYYGGMADFSGYGAAMGMGMAGMGMGAYGMGAYGMGGGYQDAMRGQMEGQAPYSGGGYSAAMMGGGFQGMGMGYG